MLAYLPTQKMKSSFCFKFLRKFSLISNNNIMNLDQASLYRPRQLSKLVKRPEELFNTPLKTPKILRFHHNVLSKRQVHLNTNNREGNESSETPLLAIVKEIFSLKDGGATNLVVENKLRSLLFYYNNINKEEKVNFLMELAEKYSVNHDVILKTSKQLSELESNSVMLMKTEEKLRNELNPKYDWLFWYLGRLEHGVKFLVGLRRDILILLSSLDAKSPHHRTVQQLNINLKKHLNVWFSVGFLEIKRVNWSSPSTLLEKVAEYEAVHPVRSWRDLKQRTGAYRRCFVYTHHSMPGEPLVILHVALTKDIEHSMDNILLSNTGTNAESQSNTNKVEEDANNINAFIFYSISATQKGLQGIDLGNYLIKQAAKELHAENPHAKMYSTLSPIPTFRQWLVGKVEAAEKGDNFLPLQDWKELLNNLNPNRESDAWAKIKSMLLDNSWFKDENLVNALKTPLMVSCSRYLYLEKRRGFAYDPVANFHLRNGAVMWRLNWMADTSPRGLTNSCGLMVNYRYYLDAADENSLKYIQERNIIASEQIIKLATQKQH